MDWRDVFVMKRESERGGNTCTVKQHPSPPLLMAQDPVKSSFETRSIHL